MEPWRERLETLKTKRNCRIITRGRRTGRPHAVPIWFAVGDEGQVFLATLRLDRDWPKNARKTPAVELEIGNLRLRGEARLVSDDSDRKRIERRLAKKYLISRIAGWFGVAAEGVFEVRILGESP